jgi:hypothetical protein
MTCSVTVALPSPPMRRCFMHEYDDATARNQFLRLRNHRKLVSWGSIATVNYVLGLWHRWVLIALVSETVGQRWRAWLDSGWWFSLIPIGGNSTSVSATIHLCATHLNHVLDIS